MHISAAIRKEGKEGDVEVSLPMFMALNYRLSISLNVLFHTVHPCVCEVPLGTADGFLLRECLHPVRPRQSSRSFP